jgi:hypothetical protein
MRVCVIDALINNSVTVCQGSSFNDHIVFVTQVMSSLRE